MSGRPRNANNAPRNGASPLLTIVQILGQRAADIALAPFRLFYAISLKFLGATGPPVFHVVLLLSLVPFIGLWSFGAGLVVRSWIPTGWKQVVYLQYGDIGQAPYADIELPTLAAGQPYDIALELVMPLFAKNTDLGNFMTSISITNPTNATLARSSRPSLIFPQPLALTPLFYSGVLRTHTLTVPLLEAFSTSSYLSSLRARIQVGRQDSWTSLGQGEGKELVVLSAFARGKPRLSGIRGFFARHSLLLLAGTTAAFFVATSVVTLAAYLYFAPSLKLAPSPLPLSSEAETEPFKAIKPEEGEPALRIKAEEEDDFDEGSSYTYTYDDETGSASAGPSGQAPASGSGSGGLGVAGSLASVTEDESEGSGSEVDVGGLSHGVGPGS